MRPEELDAQVFERKLAGGRAALAAARPEDAAVELREALELWRGHRSWSSPRSRLPG
jgi:hypothetical protein